MELHEDIYEDEVKLHELREQLGDFAESSKYRSQVKSIPSEVHNAAIITCVRTSLSISESCEFPLKTSFILFTCIQALIPLSVSALDLGYLELTKNKFLNDF